MGEQNENEDADGGGAVGDGSARSEPTGEAGAVDGTTATGEASEDAEALTAERTSSAAEELDADAAGGELDGVEGDDAASAGGETAPETETESEDGEAEDAEPAMDTEDGTAPAEVATAAVAAATTAAVATETTTDDDGPQGRVAVLKHRRASRWMHWINFPLLTIMIWSGLRIYWADLRDPFGFGVGLVGWHWFDFFPEFITSPLGLERKLARGMAFHFTFGWLFAINGLAYGIYTWRSGEWRHLLPDRHSARDSVAVIKHDLYIGDRKLPPQGRYNGAQRWSYTIIIVMGAIAVLTGLAIYRPTQLNILTTLFGGYESARTIHFFVTIGFLAFFVIHILQVIRAGWPNFASMVTGYELQPARDNKQEASDRAQEEVTVDA